MPKALSLGFTPAATPITGPVTKFGGQPSWIEAPQWPLSRSTGRPMRFIGQVALDPGLFACAEGRLAYLFMTEEEDWVDGTWEPDGGENAVVIQPGGVGTHVATASLAEGPTLFQMTEVPGADLLEAQPCEFAVSMRPVDNADFLPEAIRPEPPSKAFDDYILPLEGNKIGGTPAFLQEDEFPEGAGWRLLLQLDSTDVPFFVNFGDAGIGYAFLNADATAGKLLWQCA